MTSAKQEKKWDGSIRLDGQPNDVYALGEAVRLELAGRAEVSADEVREIIVRLAPQHNVTLGQEIDLRKLAEPWRTYFSKAPPSELIAGMFDKLPYMGTRTWMLFVSVEVMESAIACGFRRIDPTKRQIAGLGLMGGVDHAIVLPELRGEDDSLMLVGDRVFQRSVLTPLVDQGAKTGRLTANGGLVTEFGIAMGTAFEPPPAGKFDA